VQTGPNNQISLLGIFDTKTAMGEPALISPLVIAASIRFYRADRGKKTIQVFCRDKQGQLLFAPSPDVINVTDFQHDSTVSHHQYRTEKVVLTFGDYQFSIECDGKKLAMTPLYVVQEIV
jgi:hypothetical protein